MGKKAKTAEPYKDVEELNWEEQETAAPQFLAAAEPKVGDREYISSLLKEFLEKVDPELKAGNPVMAWAIYPSSIAFVFLDGRKAEIYL